MSQLTEREKAVADAAKATHREEDWTWPIFARQFLAMFDAARAFDAAQEPDPRDSGREYIAEGKRQAEPSVVETVREAAERGSDAEHALKEMRKKLAELHNTHRHKFYAAVEAATEELFQACSQMNTGLRASFGLAAATKNTQDLYRDGVIKGLEMAHEMAFGPNGVRYGGRSLIRDEIARIRSGGEIEPSVDPTSTGSTPGREEASVSSPRNAETATVGSSVTDVPSDCVSRSAAPEQPNPAAGGAPQELPKGWINFTASTWHPAADNGDMRILSGDDYNGVLGMARAALTLREVLLAITAFASIEGRMAREALASLGPSNG